MDIKQKALKWARAQKASGVKITPAMINAKMLELQEEYTPEKNVKKAIESAEQSSDLTGAENLRAMQRGPEQFGSSLRKTGVAQLPLADRYNFMGKPMGETGAKTLEASFPRTTQAMVSGNNLAPFSAMGDVASAPGRVLESGVQAGMGNGDFLDRMSQTDVPEIGSSIMRDPTAPFMGMGAGLYGALSKGASPIMKAGGLGAAGATTQAPVSMYSGMERESRGGEFGGGELGAELAISGAMGPLAPVAGSGVKMAGDLGKQMLSGLSGKTVQLLEEVGFREGKQFVKKMFNREENVSPDKVLDNLENFGDNAEGVVGKIINYFDEFENLYTENNLIIGDAVKDMGQIDLKPVVNKLNDMKMNSLSIDLQKKFKDVNEFADEIPYGYKTGKPSVDTYLSHVDDVIDEITGQSVTGKVTNVRPASETLKLRRKIDEKVNFNKGGHSHDYANSLDAVGNKARSVIKEQLEQAAVNTGNPQYVKAMSDFSNLLDTRDLVNKKILGKSGNVLDKPKNFLIGLGNPNKLDNIKLAKQVEKLIGKDLFKEAKLLQLSKEYNNGLSVFSDVSTGKNTMVGSALEAAQRGSGFLLSSPKFGAAPLTAGISAGQEAIRGGGAGKLSRQYMSPGIQLLTGGNNE